MKKALVVLLILAVAGGVFAQSVSFSGDVNTGLFFGIPGATGATPYVKGWSWAAGTDNYRVNLNGALTAEDGLSGLNFRIRVNNGTAIGSYGHGWFYAFDKVLKVTAGTNGDGIGGWGTPGFVGASFAGTTGAILDLFPTKDESFGIKLAVYSNGLNTVEKVDAYTVLGVKYNITDVVNLGLNYRLPIGKQWKSAPVAANPGATPPVAAAPGVEYESAIAASDIALGFGITALKSSVGINNIGVDAEIDDILDSDTRTIVIGEVFDLSKGDFALYQVVRAVLKPGISSAANYSPYIFACIGGSYKLSDGNITPALEVAYHMGHSAAGMGGENPPTSRWSLAWGPNFNKDQSAFKAAPQVDFKVGKATIKAYYVALVDLPSGGDTVINHYIGANFGWSF